MTQPDPASVAPAEPSTTQPPAAPEPGTTESPEPVAFDPAGLPPEAQAWLKQQVDAADKKSRTTSKDNAAREARQELTKEFAKVLGLDAGDTPPDPEQLTSHLEQARTDAWRNGTELAVLRAASRLGVNADALLDSMAFIDSLDDLTEADPRSAEFTEALAGKISAAVERDPARFKGGTAAGTPRPDPSQGSRGGAAVGVDARIADAQAKGDWRTVLSLQNEKLANLTA